MCGWGGGAWRGLGWARRGRGWAGGGGGSAGWWGLGGAALPLASSLPSAGVAGGGGGGGSNDFQWCFSQVKGAIDEDVAEGKGRAGPLLCHRLPRLVAPAPPESRA